MTISDSEPPVGGPDRRRFLADHPRPPPLNPYNGPMGSSPSNSLAADIVVAGRGAIGVSVALAVARLGRSVILVGPAPSARAQPAPGLDPRVFAISSPSAALLRSVGVWQALDPARTSPVQRHHPRPIAGPDLSFIQIKDGL